MDIFELSIMFIFLFSSVVAIEKHNELIDSNDSIDTNEVFDKILIFVIAEVKGNGVTGLLTAFYSHEFNRCLSLAESQSESYHLKVDHSKT
ncbi:18546_t:CDS:2 [Dentiscutata erythropus]|uniref:18546_t:CDS:1 n=1 Tax=Dentiscutata erythropus TaxID=1348616 RepID=A0A9N9FCK7_9GLOM|nr:18546_t:CDS:2 [Dentiscutata erythropus]